MRDVTPRALAATAAQRWREVYLRGGSWYSPDKEATYERLRRLGPAPAPADVDAVVGNDTWTTARCNEPGCEEVAAVEVGQAPDYESCTARLCARCLSRAAALCTAALLAGSAEDS